MSNRRFREIMCWVFNIGFLVAILGIWVLQSVTLGIIGTVIMAVPIFWISWKEGL